VQSLAPVVRELDAAGIEVDDLALRRPTLDEVFLHVTGPGAAEPADPAAPAAPAAPAERAEPAEPQEPR